jgi:hypothetical protein
MWTPRWGPQATVWWRQGSQPIATPNPFSQPTSPSHQNNSTDIINIHHQTGAAAAAVTAAAAATRTPIQAEHSPLGVSPLGVSPLGVSPISGTSCANCMLQEAMRSERIYALCRTNQQRLDAQTQQIDELNANIRLLQTTVNSLFDHIAIRQTTSNPPPRIGADVSPLVPPMPPPACPSPSPPLPPPPPPLIPPRLRDAECQTNRDELMVVSVVDGEVATAAGSPFLLINEHPLYFSNQSCK